MKLISTLALATTLVATTGVDAKESTIKNWVAGYGLYYSADEDKPAKNSSFEEGFGIGVEGGFRFTPDWGFRMEYTHLDLDASDASIDDTGSQFGFDGLYFIDQDSLYVFGGLRRQKFEESYKLATVGIGKHWALNDQFALVTEAGYLHTLGDNFSDYSVKLGLAYYFGQTSTPKTKSVAIKEPEVTQISDTDKDGVNDEVDRCPATPMGTSVDLDGCNIDKDGDGVNNSADQCPNTLVNTPVDVMGCAIVGDSDKDGVPDDVDACANTPEGDEVHPNGCTIFTQKEIAKSLSILFANNSSIVQNPDSLELQEFADFMKRYGKTTAIIEGHSSAPGSAKYNLFISEKRAQSVMKVLIDNYGIAAERLSAVGFGESRLLDTSNTPEAHKINRRIEVIVTEVIEVPVRE